MIPVTDEMIEAIEVFMAPMEEQEDTRRGLAAVLAIVERDHHQRTPAPDRCSDCGRTARHLQPWRELVDGRDTVVARLGPSCHRRRIDAAQVRQALPIGGSK